MMLRAQCGPTRFALKHLHISRIGPPDSSQSANRNEDNRFEYIRADVPNLVLPEMNAHFRRYPGAPLRSRTIAL
jgi:hypothetical protein